MSIREQQQQQQQKIKYAPQFIITKVMINIQNHDSQPQ
jgi:hypothetical protein